MSRLLVRSFFDDPALVGIRLEKDADPVEAFAMAPRAAGKAAREAGCLMPGFIALGAIAVLVGGSMLMTTCHDTATPGNFTPPPLASPPLPPPIQVSAAQSFDCDGGASWKASLGALDARLEPKQAAWKPWFVRTLLRVPQTDPAPWQTPRAGAEDLAARDAALALAEAFAAVDSAPDTAIVLDLPGPQSVTAAGALCDRFEPVFTFDNIPDGAGVVPAQDTLGATLFWLPRFLRGAGQRGDKPCAPVFVLDANRLNPYKNEVDRFDNRYRAKLPDAAALKAAGVKRVLYVRPQAGAVAESDDLNGLLVDWREAGVEVKALGLSAFKPVAAPAQPPTDPAASPTAPTTSAPTHVYHHYYGTGWAPYFWRSYGWYPQPFYGMPIRPMSGAGAVPDDGAWMPQRRTGLFGGLAAPPPGGVKRPAYVPPAASSPSSRPSSSSPGGSWGRSWGGSTFS